MTGSFALDLRRFAEKANKRANEAVGGIVTAIHAKVDERSPVGDATYWKSPAPKGYVGGHFRGNWQLGVGRVPTGELNRTDPSGTKVRAEIHAAIPQKAAGPIYHLVNNVPYAQRLEHGYSRQAPQGVVGLTVSEFDSLVSKAVGEAKAKVP